MMTQVISHLLETKPDFILLLTLLIGLFVILLVTIAVGVVFGNRSTLSQILSNPAVQERIKDKTLDLESILPAIIEKAAEVDRANNRGPRWYRKISDDITWDVSGLIGIAVTIVLL